MEAAKTDIKAISEYVHPSENVDSPKVINMLPKEFILRRRNKGLSSVILPQKHKILLHKHYTYEGGLSETLFFAVGTVGVYSIETPYVIFHHSIPGLQFHIGFFVSPNDFTAQDYLPDDRPKYMLDKIVQACNARSIIHEVIPGILEEKGFYDYYSILHRIRDQR